MTQIRKATRKKAKLRLGISAPTGAGKTYSSLLIASGIGQKVGLIDTENGSGDLYAEDKTIKEALPEGYDIINLSAPYDPQKYLDAIKAFETSGYDVIIIDSLSHAWSGAGGLLDKQGKEADRSGNSYVAWRKITPQHNALVDAIIQSSSHIIACLRAKTEYVQEKNEQGKTIVRKVGLAPVMRDGIEYEFTVFGELDQTHTFHASKDRTGTFGDTYQVPSKQMGEKLLLWLSAGEEPAKEFDWKGWAAHFAEEVKACESSDEVIFLVTGEQKHLDKLKEAEPAYYKRLRDLIAERETLLQKTLSPEEIGYREFEKAKADNIRQLKNQTKGAA